MGCEYLLKNTKHTKKNGTKFIYLRDLDGAIVKGKYNMLRHCGCLWALSKTYNTVLFENCNDEIITTINDLFEYPKKHTDNAENHVKNNDRVALLRDKEWYKLGGNALYALSLHEYKKLTTKFYRTNNDDMAIERKQMRIYNGMKRFIKNDGSVKHSKINAKTKMASEFMSEYYPGEAVLSLCILKDYDAAFKITTNLKKTRDAVSEKDQIHDHWLLQGIELLYRHYSKNNNGNNGNNGNNENKRAQIVLEYGNKIGQAIIKHEDKYEERSCRIACRLEGLIPLYRITKNKEYLNAINKLVVKLLKSQCDDVKHKACGAFKDEGGYQIDYTQHSVSALCEYYKLLK